MNLYIRFFDEEALVRNVDEALKFLTSLDYFVLNDEVEADLRRFVDSNAVFPKHIRVGARSFFIVIKTTASTLQDFKARGSEQAKTERAPQKPPVRELAAKWSVSNPGWYAAKIVFKRMVAHPVTQKCSYVDTPFVCKVKAESVLECYDKVISHLRNRSDVDPRSQFPGIKSPNFKYEFLG